MSALAFSVVDARAERYAATPTVTLGVQVNESTGTPVHAIALRTQVRIEPQRRTYDGKESDQLVELFGPPERYGDTLRSMLWMHVSTMVLAFSEEATFELSLPASYDFDVAANKYLSGLEDGEIPMALHFSGMVFVEGERGVATEFVPWSCETRYRLPVAIWREAIDACFPNAAWLRVHRDTFAELNEVRIAQGSPTWDAALTRLCELAKAAR